MSARPVALAAFVLTACTQEPAPVTPAAPSVEKVASPTPPAASSAPVASAAPKEKPVCIPATAGKGELVHLEAKDGKVLACFYDEKVGGEGTANALAGQSHPCVLFDPESGSLASAPPYKVPEYAEPAPPAITVTTTADTVKACKGATCKTVKVTVPKAAKPVAKKPAKGEKVGKGKGKGKGKKADAPPVEAEPVPGLSVVVDPEMTRVFVFVRDHAKDGAMILHGDTYDLATGKRTAHVPLSGVIDGVFSDGSNDHSGSWVGNRLVLRDQVCCGPGAAIVLLDPVKGGMKVLHGFAGSYAQHATAKTWYATSEKSLSWVDPEAMSVTPVFTGQGPALDPESTSAGWTEVGGQLAFVWANPPGFAMIDAASHKAGAARSLALCTP